MMNIGTGGGTLVHEIVHPFVAANFPHCPPWFNEGLGSLYEQCGEEDGRIHGYTELAAAAAPGGDPQGARPLVQEALRDERRTSSTRRTGARTTARPATSATISSSRACCGSSTARSCANARKTRPATKRSRPCSGRSDMDAFKKEWEAYVLKLRYPVKRVYGGFIPRFFTRNAQSSAISSIRLAVGLPAPWPARVAMRISTGLSHAWARLQRGGELEAVARHHAVVGVGRGHQRGRVAGARLDVVVGRVGQQGLELARDCRTSRSRRPRCRPSVNLWKRSMSITPTAGRQAPNRSGRWVITAPTSRPPLLPPWMASLSGRV